VQVGLAMKEDVRKELANQGVRHALNIGLLHQVSEAVNGNEQTNMRHKAPPTAESSHFPGTRTWTEWVATGKQVFEKDNRSYVTHTAVFLTLFITCLACAIGQWGPKEDDSTRMVNDLMEAHDRRGEEVPDFWKDPLGLKDFRQDKLRRALPKLAFAFSVWIVGLYFNNLCQAWLQKNMADYYATRWQPSHHKNNPVMLWDMGYTLLPNFPHSSITELVAQGAPILVVLRFCVLPGPFSMRWTFLSRMFLLWGVLWALRAITIVSTVLPNPDESCKPRILFPDNIFKEALALMPSIMFWRHDVTCQDVMFSGHTVCLTLGTLLWAYFVDWAPWPQWAASSPAAVFTFKFGLIANMLVGYYCIIASKLHYTADVLMASMLTILIFQGYHAALRSAFLRQDKGASFYRSPLHSFLVWFDEDAADVLLMKSNNIPSKKQIGGY
jgi:hypothetical protein